METTCEFIIQGKKLKSFVKKYQPSHLYEISSDEDISLKITYEETDGKITDFIDIQTATLDDSSHTYFNSFFAYALIRYRIPAFYGLQSNPKAFAFPEEKKDVLETQFKIIAHLRENHLLIHPIPEDKYKAIALLHQSHEYKISQEEIMLVPAIHALELNIKIYENNATSRCYKQSPQRITSIKVMRAFIEDMKKHTILSDIPPSKLLEIFILTLQNEIYLTFKDHKANSRLGIFFKWHTPKLAEIYHNTLTFLLETPNVSKTIRKSL